MASPKASEATGSFTFSATVPRNISGSPTSSPSPRVGLHRVQSQQERIDEILTNARRRSIALAQPTTMAPTQSSRSPLTETESDADETTNIVGGRARSYQSITSTFPATSSRQLSSTNLNCGNGSRSEAGQGSQNNGNGNDPGEGHKSWMKRKLSKYGSIELENKGSVARDHLALERTFLAWLRTSLAFASIGIAITQLFRLNTASIPTDNSDAYLHLRQLGKPLGATFLAISIVVLWVGFNRYFESQHWIIRGKFPASRGSIFLVAIIAVALMVTSLVLILVVEPTAFEK